MKIAASQPTFLPYAGYFGLIDEVDKFIIMDTVSFSSRSWQQRVLIRSKNDTKLLTIPVIKNKLRGQLIKNTHIDISSNYIYKHLENIRHEYSKFPFFDRYYPSIEHIYKNDHKKLLNLNIEFIKKISFFLNINEKKIILLSDLNIEKKYLKDELICKICESLGNVDEYISTIGAENYLKENKFLNNNFKIKYFEFTHDKNEITMYNNKNFHLSIIDLLFRHGEKSLNIIKSKFKYKKD
jgi:hypothetical protein